MKKLLKGYSSHSGVVRNKTLCYLLTTRDDLVKDNIAHSRNNYKVPRRNRRF